MSIADERAGQQHGHCAIAHQHMLASPLKGSAPRFLFAFRSLLPIMQQGDTDHRRGLDHDTADFYWLPSMHFIGGPTDPRWYHHMQPPSFSYPTQDLQHQIDDTIARAVSTLYCDATGTVTSLAKQSLKVLSRNKILYYALVLKHPVHKQPPVAVPELISSEHSVVAMSHFLEVIQRAEG